MSNPGFSEDLQIEAAEAFKRYGSKREAARAIGVEESSFYRRLKAATKSGLLGPARTKPGFVIRSISSKEGDAWVKQVPEPGEQFEVPDGHTVKGESALIDADGRVIQKWVKTREGGINPTTAIDAVKSAFEGWTAPNFIAPEPGETDEDLLTIYSLADVHLGLQAVADESGADFNLSIAAERFRDVTGRLFDRSPNSDTAIILQLGDWSHVDDDLALTPSSKNTLQVSDRLLDITRCGVRVMVDYVYHALQKHRRVIVKVLKGNHDLNAWIALYVALAEHFRDNDRVTIDHGSADYWFFRFGSTLIGAHHGHRLKPEQMAGAMAMECREDWGETLYRLFLHGHLHHRRVIEILGVSVECMRTIAEVDHHHSGKYGSGKSLTSITIHRTDGEDGRVQINLPPVRKRAAA